MEASGIDPNNAKTKKPEALSQRKEAIEKEYESNLSRRRKEAPVGILRLDTAAKPRRTSSDIRLLAQGEPPSPQPSVDRLSVTFAEDSVRSDSSTRINLYIPRTSSQTMDKMHLPAATDPEDSDEEDYSASVNAIILRRASTKKSRRRSQRRASSPFTPDILPGTEGGRRRSSVYTTSSGDTAITVDESLAPELTQVQIFENIKLHKEVLGNVKMQPWNMRKKLKLVMQAKNYVKRHEGALHERFTQTHSIKNMLASSKLTEVLQRNSIEDEVTFSLFHHADVNGGQDLFLDNHTSVIRSRFDRSLPTKFIIHGWTHGQDAHWVKEMREVMASVRKWNVVVVGWAPMSHTIYSEARIHSRVVGRQLGKMCIFLLKLGYIRLPSLHFIGHSMGAHIAGYASETIKKEWRNQIPDRITALDPIALMFERPYLEIPQERLDADDAHFVDVIHTNGGGIGMMTAIGDVDFYPNGGMKQPGCGSWICSHERSCEFWTASIKNPCQYRAISYNSWGEYLEGTTRRLSKVSMGIGAGASIPKGLYFLETSEKNPYVNTSTNALDFIK